MTQQKTKKTKQKRKINFWNYHATNPLVMLMITILRITMIVFWVLVPIFIALSYFYDSGMKYFSGFVFTVFSGYSLNADGEIIFGDVIGQIELGRRILAPLIWLICLTIVGFAGVLPYFSKITYHQRVIIAVNQFLWPILFATILWVLWAIKGTFDAGEPTEINGVIWPRYQYWTALQETFVPWSTWMIVYQSFLGVWIIFGIFTSIEANLIKKGKLDFAEFFRGDVEQKSLVHQIVEGRLTFGENSAEDAKDEMRKIRSEHREKTTADRNRRLEELNKKKTRKKLDTRKNKNKAVEVDNIEKREESFEI